MTNTKSALDIVNVRKDRRRHLALVLIVLAAAALSSLVGTPTAAQNWYTGNSGPSIEPDPDILDEVGIDQRLGEQIPLDLTFRDATGAEVRLGDYFGERPVILSLVYYECPMLCTQVLNGLTTTLRAVNFDPGNEFEIVTISFDPHDTPKLAAAKKAGYVERYDRAGAGEAWHFLTGDQEEIDRLTEAVGFRYAYDPVIKQFAHASVIMIATPAGRLARYFYGIEYAPRDVRLGLIEASEEKIGNPVDQLLLYCFAYNPATGTYGAVIMRILRLAGVATLLALVGFIVLMARRDRRARLSSGVAT